MNTFLTNQLEDVKNDLKGCMRDGCPAGDELEFCGKRNWYCNKCQSKIKTKLQKYHEWASEELRFINEDIDGENSCLTEEVLVKRTEELSTFISEVEKLAKENNIKLKSYIEELE